MKQLNLTFVESQKFPVAIGVSEERIKEIDSLIAETFAHNGCTISGALEIILPKLKTHAEVIAAVFSMAYDQGYDCAGLKHFLLSGL